MRQKLNFTIFILGLIMVFLLALTGVLNLVINKHNEIINIIISVIFWSLITRRFYFAWKNDLPVSKNYSWGVVILITLLFVWQILENKSFFTEFFTKDIANKSFYQEKLVDVVLIWTIVLTAFIRLIYVACLIVYASKYNFLTRSMRQRQKKFEKATKTLQIDNSLNDPFFDCLFLNLNTDEIYTQKELYKKAIGPHILRVDHLITHNTLCVVQHNKIIAVFELKKERYLKANENIYNKISAKFHLGKWQQEYADMYLLNLEGTKHSEQFMRKKYSLMNTTANLSFLNTSSREIFIYIK